MDTPNNTQQIITTTASIIAAVLVIIGIVLIVQSNAVYNDSLNYVQKAVAADTSLKGKIVASPNYATIKDGYSESLLYFTLAIGVVLLVILLPRLQTFSISPTGGINVTLTELQQQVDQLKVQNNELQSKSTDIGGGKKVDEQQLAGVKMMVIEDKQKVALDPEDPQKGMWGGEPAANGRKLAATVNNTGVPGLYKVKLTVESTDASKPLTGLVIFHLHPTFKNQNPIIAVRNGIAELKLNWVYGSFTAGAEADNGNTKLELDLATLPGVPQAFKDR